MVVYLDAKKKKKKRKDGKRSRREACDVRRTLHWAVQLLAMPREMRCCHSPRDVLSVASDGPRRPVVIGPQDGHCPDVLE